MQKFLEHFKGDTVIWSVMVILSLFSLMTVYSATGSLAWRMDKDSGFYMVKQFFFLGVGLVIMYLIHRINYTKFAKLSLVMFLICIPLLIYTLFFGTKLNEGSRWITIPVINQTFQTSDFARLVLFIFLARQLSIKQRVIKDFKKGFLPVLIPVLIICVLIAPANLSTALLLGLTCCILFFIGRIQVKHIALLAITGLSFMFLIYVLSKTFGFGRGATWEQRIESYLGIGDKEEKNTDSDYQITQAKIAIVNGSVLGLGPGNSLARDFLPHPYSDFIFAIVIEEYGLVGGFFLIMLYVVFLWRSIRIFKRCPYAFGAFLAVGLSFTLVFQAMINMGVNVHLLPVTGLTLPFVSMGGSSIWFNSVAVGIILSVSRYVDEMEGQEQLQTVSKIENKK